MVLQKELPACFDSLQTDKAVGFQVNYKDSDTDDVEKQLAKEFGVTYQHTKVILKDGKPVLKEIAQWDSGQLVDAVTKAVQ